MKLIFKILIIYLCCFNVFGRDNGETEITTEDGIEVFQDEKYYLLKKNVNILSDDFELNADDVRINFNQNLYDITEIKAKGNVIFESHKFRIKCIGELLKFQVELEKLKISGEDSLLITENIEMFSDGSIEVENITGNFSLIGLNSELKSESVIIKAENINGKFISINDKKEIDSLKVFDEKISFVKNNETEMFAKQINFNETDSIIELIDNVTIIRNEEKITGDYGTLDTKKNSYKIKSKQQTKVKVIIQNNE